MTSKEVMYVPTTAPLDDGVTPKLYVPSTAFKGAIKGKNQHRRCSGRSLLCLSVSSLLLVLAVVLLCVFLLRGVPEELEKERRDLDVVEATVNRQQQEINEIENELEEEGIRPLTPMKPKLPHGEACKLMKDSGPCMAAVPRWFFDQRKGQCGQFTYGGCQGNENNFVTLHECQMECEDQENIHVPSDLLQPRIRIDDGEDDENPCRIDPDAGPCMDQLPRYFFDKSDGTCKKFLYGRLRGQHQPTF